MLAERRPILLFLAIHPNPHLLDNNHGRTIPNPTAPVTPIASGRISLATGRITDEVVANIRSWKHSGFSVDQSIGLEAQDQQSIEGVIQYFLRFQWETVFSLDTPARIE